MLEIAVQHHDDLGTGRALKRFNTKQLSVLDSVDDTGVACPDHSRDSKIADLERIGILQKIATVVSWYSL